MLLPSLNHLLVRTVSTFKRFPLTILDSILGAVCFFLYLESEKGSAYNTGLTEWQRFGFTALLAIPIFFAVELYLERQGDRLGETFSEEGNRRRHNRPSVRIFLYFIALFLLGFFYVNFSASPSDAIQLFVLFLAAHLIVSFVAYLRRNETNGFWQLNKVMFLRILIAVLYTLVLQLGLSLALGAIDVLFGVDVAPQSYAQLGVILFGVFNTWFFLAGIPYSLGAQDHRTDYPKGLKIFTQFVLLPLVTIYLAILYPYAVKLLIDWDLPKGWVSNPVLWFAVIGILSFLLLYPIRNESGNEWIRKFSRYYFIALLPLLALPTLGIYTRVRDYGITEERYFVIILTVWLLGISLYFIISKKKDIRMIPISLAAIAIIAAVGPVSAFTISRISQLSRLEYYLKKNNLLGKGRDINQQAIVPEKDQQEIASITNYFRWQRKERILENWLKPRLPHGVTIGELDDKTTMATLLNYKPTAEPTDLVEARSRVASRVAMGKAVTPITGFDYYIPISLGPTNEMGSDSVFSFNAVIVKRTQQDVFVAHGRDSLRIRYLDVIRELKTRRDTLTRAGRGDSFTPNIFRMTGRLQVLLAFDHITFPDYFAEDTVSTEDRPYQEYKRDYRADGALFVNIINPRNY